MSATHFPIGSIGGGLTAVRVLQVHGIESAVFELEASPAARGGMLDIRAENGQKALHAAGLHDGPLKVVYQGSQSIRLPGADGTVHAAEPGDGSDHRPETYRGDLRDLLLISLPGGTVHWAGRSSMLGPWATVGTR